VRAERFHHEARHPDRAVPPRFRRPVLEPPANLGNLSFDADPAFRPVNPVEPKRGKFADPEASEGEKQNEGAPAFRRLGDEPLDLRGVEERRLEANEIR